MKKTYINPEMEIVKMKIQQHLLDGSVVEGPGYGGEGSADEAEGKFDGFDW